MNTKTKKIRFRGVDSCNRPVFVDMEGKSEHYGATEKLFPRDASAKYVLSAVTEQDLCFFGRSFGCEPFGSSAGNVEIVKPEIGFNYARGRCYVVGSVFVDMPLKRCYETYEDFLAAITAAGYVLWNMERV